MFALIVPDVGHHDALAVIEEIVVAHVGRNIELGTPFHSLVEQETASAAAQCHA